MREPLPPLDCSNASCARPSVRANLAVAGASKPLDELVELNEEPVEPFCAICNDLSSSESRAATPTSSSLKSAPMSRTNLRATGVVRKLSESARNGCDWIEGALDWLECSRPNGSLECLPNRNWAERVAAVVLAAAAVDRVDEADEIDEALMNELLSIAAPN